jgi:D-tagatose-1,6-bisphosphate aldolase subunit GatZ/KbaZ
MTDMKSHFVEHLSPYSSVGELCNLLRENRAGKRTGIYSVCSASRLVLEAAFAQAAHDGSPLLIEATSNQVNQEGGYTGLTPTQFRDYVHTIAKEINFPTEKLILGGDHLGPNPWRTQPAESAMEKACAMVSAYAAAGFSKIHLDASMPCSDDRTPLPSEEIARRAAKLCESAESSTAGFSDKPVYIIGTEVPTPGGAQEELAITVTTTASLQETLDVHHEAFARKGLFSALDRIIGVVVQPGVEFGDETVADYVSEQASELSRSIVQHNGIVFEAHSTDYQTLESLGQLVRDHFAILKVGPELTFVMREAIFGLASIEAEWIVSDRRSEIRRIVESVMVHHPENWKAYYRGDEHKMKIARAYSLSDRIRYYWPNVEVTKSLAVLIRNLEENPAPVPLVAQYLPHQAEAIRGGSIKNIPTAIIHHRIQESLSRYSDACGLRNLERG